MNHPFVYLLPIIFLFGARRTPGVLATVVFALPPIVGLTNLGLRQVSEDVVEAARAFGATESRVLREVQLPLARPAIPPMPCMEPEPETVAPEAAPAAPGLATLAPSRGGGRTRRRPARYGLGTLTWGRDAGLLTGWARFDDTDLPGLHSGVDATGGSWFGILLGVVGLAAALGGAVAALRTSSGVEPARVGTRGVIGIVVLKLFLGLAGASGSWILDQRSDAAQIAAEHAAEAEGVDQGGLAAAVLGRGDGPDSPRDRPRFRRRRPGNRLHRPGTHVGRRGVVLGRLVRRSATQQFLGMVMFGLGCAITAIGMAWVATFVRLATPALSPGASSFFVVVGGLIFAAWGWRASRPGLAGRP